MRIKVLFDQLKLTEQNFREVYELYARAINDLDDRVVLIERLISEPRTARPVFRCPVCGHEMTEEKGSCSYICLATEGGCGLSTGGRPTRSEALADAKKLCWKEAP